MYCPKCGNEIDDSANYCSNCGTKIHASNNNLNETKTLRLLAFIFMLISTVSVGICIIPLAWMIPMTIICYNNMKEDKKCSLAFAICTLLFVSIVSGVLLIVDSESEAINN